MIYLLTGPIRTGKTSAVLEWCSKCNDTDGVLCPDDQNGKRYFLNIKSKEEYLLEVDNDFKNDIVSIGSYHFLKKSFEKANEYLINQKENSDYKYLIIDELGKLELQNKGLHSSASHLIQKHIENDNQHLILIVRDYLIDQIISHYNISEYTILKKETLITLE